MYLWVVIATFITILYSYNISVRSDLDRVHAETRASVAVAKFRAQHNAVKDYLNSQSMAKTGQNSVTYYPGDGVHIKAGTGTEIEMSQIENYLPVGFSEDAETVTKVYCIEEGDPNSPNCDSGGGPSCCSNDYTGIYVVSYRQLPSRWINKITTLPNSDVIGAMAKGRGFGKVIGYTDTIDGKLVLSGGHLVYEIDENTGERTKNAEFEYKEIYKAIREDPDFIEARCDQENVHCLYAIQQIYR